MRWVKIRSWHAVQTMTRGGAWLTLCGRLVRDAQILDTLPADKSCETCLRIYAREADKE